jgi:murein DD-endopeptidase MepM/ murein hydrolase activator NlpD
MKRVLKLFVVSLMLFLLCDNVNAANENTTLKDLKEKLANYEKEYNKVQSDKAEVSKKIKEIEAELEENAEEITKCEEDIEYARQKIKELNIEIDNKQLEIDNLISFEQISSGDNVYLEYVFNAKSFTDFIYRVSVVEQLTEYNDGLIDDMNELIKKNEKTQEELKEKIVKSEESIKKLNKTLEKHNLTMDDLNDDHKDVKADLEASRKEVEGYEKLYKQYGCAETDSILDCVKVPYADGLTRPLVSGKVTSEFGMRLHPTQGIYKMHQGIDIGVPMGTKVYASAAGIVSKITRVANPNKANSSCGGNMVYIKHRIDGKEYTSIYMHLHTINVKLNDFVTLDTVVGTSGGGESYDRCTTGPHLHFGVKLGSSHVNPRNYIDFPAKRVKWSSRWY